MINNGATKHDIVTCANNSSLFPPLLREIPLPPARLYLKGMLDFGRPHVAIVGTRRATAAGKETARALARDLARANVVVVSGLAFGIDAAAHEGALEGGGATVAVLPTSLDRIYPRHHQGLAELILAQNGALISEYAAGTPSYEGNFLARNRIISGLSLGVIIIEAPQISGALATARFALEQNRDVFVIPGPISHPNYVGSHRLIQQGAMLITSAHDALEALGIASPLTGDAESDAALTIDQKKIIAIVREAGAPMDVDTVAEQSGLAIEVVSGALAALTVAGLIKERGGLYEL